MARSQGYVSIWGNDIRVIFSCVCFITLFLPYRMSTPLQRKISMKLCVREYISIKNIQKCRRIAEFNLSGHVNERAPWNSLFSWLNTLPPRCQLRKENTWTLSKNFLLLLLLRVAWIYNALTSFSISLLGFCTLLYANFLPLGYLGIERCYFNFTDK